MEIGAKVVLLTVTAGFVDGEKKICVVSTVYHQNNTHILEPEGARELARQLVMAADAFDPPPASLKARDKAKAKSIS